MLESQSKAQNTHILAWFPLKTWVKHFGWGPGSDDLSKKA